MPLSSEQVYNELNGQEVKLILLERFRALLDSVPDFQRHLTLPRVKMSVFVHLDIFGRRIPFVDLKDELTLSTKVAEKDIELASELEASDEVSADTGYPIANTDFDGQGQPPDEIREQHGIPILTPVRDRTTRIHQDQPVKSAEPVPPANPVVTNPPFKPPANPPGPSGKPWAGFRTLDRGGAVRRGFNDYQPESSPVISPNAGNAAPEKGIMSEPPPEVKKRNARE